MQQTHIILLILSIIHMTACNSKSKEFEAPDRKFKFILPADWEEYDDGEENTYAFFNEKTWTGNLRITPISREAGADQKGNEPGNLLESELSDNKGAVRLKLGQFDCVHYRKAINQEGEELIMFYWIVMQRNRLFVCSLTVDKTRADQPAYRSIIEEVPQIIESIEGV